MNILENIEGILTVNATQIQKLFLTNFSKFQAEIKRFVDNNDMVAAELIFQALQSEEYQKKQLKEICITLKPDGSHKVTYVENQIKQKDSHVARTMKARKADLDDYQKQEEERIKKIDKLLEKKKK